MADAFRGLTIRLGADARPLNSAINSVVAHSRKAQTQLSALSKALKIDPSNARAAQLSMGLLGDKAVLAARSVRDINAAMSQVSAGTKKLANSNENIYAAAHKVKEEYKHVDAELQRIYDSAARVLASEMRQKDTTLDYAKSLEQANEKVKKLRSSYQNTVKDGEKFNEATKELNRLLAIANGRDLGRMFDTEGKPEKLLVILRKLRNEHSALAGQSSQLKAAEGYKAMEMQLESWRAQLKQATAEAARFRSEFYSINASGATAKLSSRIERIDAELEQATAAARRLDAAFKQAPNDIGLATSKLRAEAAVHESIKDKLEAQKAILGSMDEKVVEQANSTRNLYKWVSETEHEWAKASERVAIAQAKVDGLNKELKEAKSTELIGPSRSIKTIESDLEKVNGELTEAKSKANTLDDELKTANAARKYRETADDVRILEAELNQARVKASALGRALDFSKTIRTMGYGLYSTITPAIMIAGRYALESAREIDSAYRDMRKTVNGTEEEFQHLLDSALQFSTTHFTTAEQMLEIESIGGQLGIAASDLEAFGETVANLDIATNIDADTVAEQLGKMGSVLGITEDQYDNFGDALVRLGNNMPVMESDIMTLATRFMGMGKVVGMSADQILGWSAAASATGQKSEAAGSSMQRFISNMETAVVAGGEDLEKFASIAGMSADEFAAAFNNSASDAMEAFINGLGDMQKRGDSVNQALKELGINNVRDKQLLEGLAVQAANAGDDMSLLAYALQLSSDAYNGFATQTKDGSIEYAGDAAREAQKKAEGFSGQMQEMINTAQLLSTELANGALPYIVALKDAFQAATTALSAMPDGMKTAIVGVLGFAAALGPTAVAIGAVGSAIDSMMEMAAKAAAANTLSKVASGGGLLERALARVASVSPRAGSALETVALYAMEAGSTMAKFAPMFALPALAIAGLAIGISDAAAKADNFNKSVDGYSNAIKDSLPSLEESAGGFSKMSGSIQHAATDLDKLTEAQVNVKNAITERNAAAQSEIAELSAAKSVIDKYLGKTIETAEEQRKFTQAIGVVNEACHTQFEVVDAATGKVRDEAGAYLTTAEAIDKYIEEKRKSIQQEALSADYADAHQQEREAYREMTSQLATYYDLMQKAEDARGSGDFASADEFAAAAADAYAYYEDLFAIHKEAKAGEEAIVSEMEAAADSTKEAEKSLHNLLYGNESWVDTFKGVFGDQWASGLQQFDGALQRAGVSQDEFAAIAEEDMARVVAAYARTGDIEYALEQVGISCTTLKDQYAQAFEEMNSSFDDLASHFQGGGEALAEALYQAGYSTDYLKSMGAENFAALAAECGYDIEAIIAKLQELDSQPPADAEVNVETNADEAAGDVDNLAGSVESVPDGDVNIDDSEVTSADENVENLGSDVESLPDSKDISITVSGGAESALSNIYWYLTNMPTSKEVTVTTHEVKDAKGGFYALHAAGGNFKLHGSGGFITSGPTVLGADRLGRIHIAGEAGREWIQKHADGTTSIVPIQNRKYLKPYAATIADMIGGNGGKQVVYNITLDYKAGDDANKMVRELGYALRTSAMMEG